jgi:hypothetical protein
VGPGGLEPPTKRLRAPSLRRKNQQNWVFSAHVRRRLFTFSQGVLLVVHWSDPNTVCPPKLAD